MLMAWHHGVGIIVAATALLGSSAAYAEDYSQLSLPELHAKRDKRPLGPPIGVSIVGGLALIGGGYLALYGLSFEAACQASGTNCSGGTELAIGAVMAGAGAVVTTVGVVWLVTWDQTRRDVQNEISRRQTARLGAAPLFLPSGAGLRLSLQF